MRTNIVDIVLNENDAFDPEYVGLTETSKCYIAQVQFVLC